MGFAGALSDMEQRLKEWSVKRLTYLQIESVFSVACWTADADWGFETSS
jgi:hypothetical protein